MVSMSMSSSLSPMSGANFLPIVALKCKPHLGPSASQDQAFALAGLAFSPSSDELERSSAPGHGHFLCLLQENSLSYGCLLLIGSASAPRSNQSGCGDSHLGFVVSIFWMVSEGQGCFSVLGGYRLQTLEV